ncbi:hypothetical protein X965_19740 [Morganella sp. EGD-HP17]|nr:hypothetical protein X965_19740 [Morganella sp. EGD-HP17]
MAELSGKLMFFTQCPAPFSLFSAVFTGHFYQNL